MKNKEKYAKEIVEFACERESFGVEKSTGLPMNCRDLICCECLLDGVSSCLNGLKEWAESEYVERPVISKRDRAFLDYLSARLKYISRGDTGFLYVYECIPPCSVDSLESLDMQFPMIKLEDNEPWLIEDLKKLKVVDEY